MREMEKSEIMMINEDENKNYLLHHILLFSYLQSV